MNYTVIDDPTRFFENSSKVHCIVNNDISTVLCGRELGIQWEQCNEDDEMGIDKAMQYTSCKICLKKLQKLSNKKLEL